jgi:hypothetical protein
MLGGAVAVELLPWGNLNPLQSPTAPGQSTTQSHLHIVQITDNCTAQSFHQKL